MGGAISRPTSSRPQDTPVLRTIDVRHRFGDKVVLDGVSIEVHRGTLLGLLGPNGAGKTTFMSIVAGILKGSGGSVELVDGARLGLMPQEYSLYPALTVRENLRFAARASGVGRRHLNREIERLLELVGLNESINARTSTLSGGMKRRLSFAVALVGRADVMLLDEPTVGVDPQSRLAIFDLIRDYVESGGAVVYSSHYMEEVQAMADDVVIIHEGAVVAQGTVSQVLEQHGEAFAEVEVLGSSSAAFTSRLDMSAVALDGDVVGDATTARIRLRVTDRSAALETILGAAKASDTQIVDLRFREPTLEAAFIALTGRELRD